MIQASVDRIKMLLARIAKYNDMVMTDSFNNQSLGGVKGNVRQLIEDIGKELGQMRSEVNNWSSGAPANGHLLHLTDAALRLAATQNNDGGWEWMNPDTDPSTGVPSPSNTLGVTAQAMLDCYKRLGLSTLLDCCVAAYEYMVANSQDPNPSKHRIRGPDIPFLVELSEVTGDSTYADFARARYEAAIDEFGGETATGFAQYIRDLRIVSQNFPTLVAWDVNFYLQGTLALDRYFPGQGYDAKAEEMAEVIYNFLYVNGFNFDDQTQYAYWLVHTGAIEAFVTTGLHLADANSLVGVLIASQQLDGRFVGVEDSGDTQTTAYAVISLLKAGEGAAASKGVDYLGDNQLDNGGWEWHYGTEENTEVTSEAAQAIHDFLEAS